LIFQQQLFTIGNMAVSEEQEEEAFQPSPCSIVGILCEDFPSSESESIVETESGIVHMEWRTRALKLADR